MRIRKLRRRPDTHGCNKRGEVGDDVTHRIDVLETGNNHGESIVLDHQNVPLGIVAQRLTEEGVENRPIDRTSGYGPGDLFHQHPERERVLLRRQRVQCCPGIGDSTLPVAGANQHQSPMQLEVGGKPGKGRG